MNKMTLLRLESTDAGVFGRMDLSWDGWQGVTLERMAVEIPIGVYSLEWHISPHLNNARVPMLIGVPNRSYILLHWGNTQACSDGCILVGEQRDGNAIDSTQKACKELFALIDAVGISNVSLSIS